MKSTKPGRKVEQLLREDGRPRLKALTEELAGLTEYAPALMPRVQKMRKQIKQLTGEHHPEAVRAGATQLLAEFDATVHRLGYPTWRA